MKLKRPEYLFLNDPEDNVATAMGGFKAGAIAPVITSEGKKVREVRLRAQVPPYFKINIKDLSDEESIVKLGEVIGVTVARVFVNEPLGRTPSVKPVTVPAGTPIHDTNIIITEELWRTWDAGARAYEAIAELQYVSRQAPFKLGKALKSIGQGNPIRLADVSLHPTLRERLFSGGSTADENLVIGLAHTRIPVHSYLRLGCCEEKEYELPVLQENIDALIAAYRHSRRLVV